MTRAQYLKEYVDGLATRDFDRLIGSLTDGYTMGDPNAGRIEKAAMREYVAGLAAFVDEIRGNGSSAPLLGITRELTREEGDETTVLVWWQIPGTPMERAGFIRVGDDGVRSERLAYYAKIAA